jgi:molecular chaperone DnaJ
MRNKGIPRLQSHGRGDQLVRIVVWTPTKLSPQEKGMLEELASGEHMHPPKGGRGFFERVKEAIL